MLDMKQYPLKNLRGLAGLTQEELAEKIGVTARTIVAYESEEKALSKVSYKRLCDIASALDVPIEAIFLG